MKKRAKSPRVRRERSTLVLQSEYTTATAAELKAALVPLFACHETIGLDASGAMRVGTAALQVLAAFVRDRRAQGRLTEWRGASPAFVDATKVLGLTELLDLPAEQAA
jgi:phospholipid transport system transporter-binding protein